MIQTEHDSAALSVTSSAILELISEIEKRDGSSRDRGFKIPDHRGYTVVNAVGTDVGKVADLYVNPNTRQPEYALLQLGNHTLGIGDRKVLVAVNDIEVLENNQVKVSVHV